jgi:hypothetical protein
MISHIDTHFCECPSWYVTVVKLVNMQRIRISVDGKCLEHYHVQGIAGKCYDMRLVAIVLSQQCVKLHDHNK